MQLQLKTVYMCILQLCLLGGEPSLQRRDSLPGIDLLGWACTPRVMSGYCPDRDQRPRDPAARFCGLRMALGTSNAGPCICSQVSFICWVPRPPPLLDSPSLSFDQLRSGPRNQIRDKPSFLPSSLPSLSPFPSSPHLSPPSFPSYIDLVSGSNIFSYCQGS